MSTKHGFVNGFVLPGILFPALTALGVRLIANSLTVSGLGAELSAQCAPGANSSYFHPFTGVHGIDGFICGLVAFFHAELEPQLSPYLLYFAGTSGFLMAFPAIESHRKGRSLFIAFPIIVGLLGQTITIGITLTIYWLAFIWTGASSRRADAHSHITKPQAESIIFATAVGSMLPSMGLMLFKDPKVTAYWQIFPVYASIAGLAYGLLRPAPRTTESGYKLVRQMYMGMFVSSAIMHLWIVGPKLLEPPALASFVFPSTTSLPTTASLSARADDFLKWDLIFAFGSSVLATLWFARDAAEFIVIASWHLFAVPLIGPGASCTGIALWREAALNDEEVESDPRFKQ
ncbi:hypothetical protein BDN71DRAFT_1451817 [Pleurotus eryngii]|uniref:Uncharacterized protein n=1 Tax=Pleurotus eryngii TaxID=5323 RepID=A0A9P5ZRN4_PLEER|nr:hypothetical protein BDN71DRAFT_1451817 [Pleurotus eryngii]